MNKYKELEKSLNNIKEFIDNYYNEYVYCASCRYFNLDLDGTPDCCMQSVCNIKDCEDGKERKYRQYYESR